MFGLLVSATDLRREGRPSGSISHTGERNRSRREETAAAPASVNFRSPTRPRSLLTARFEIHAAAEVSLVSEGSSKRCSKSQMISLPPAARQFSMSLLKATPSHVCTVLPFGHSPKGQSCTATRTSPHWTVSGSSLGFMLASPPWVW